MCSRRDATILGRVASCLRRRLRKQASQMLTNGGACYFYYCNVGAVYGMGLTN